MNKKEIWIEGKLHNRWIEKSFFDNGNLFYEIEYQDGQKDGIYKVYRLDGTLGWEREYKDDKIHGLCKEYDENGKLINEEHYINGKLIK